jgi:hypothetical protein
MFYRSVSVSFAFLVLGIFAAMGAGQPPAEWVYFLPLLPLACLMGSGCYLFALPYVARRQRKGGKQTNSLASGSSE